MPDATAISSGKIVRWTSTDYSIRYFDIYRRIDSVTASITTSDIVAKVGAGTNHYVDLGDNIPYWYWIKSISWASKSSAFTDTITALTVSFSLGVASSDLTIVGDNIVIGTACSTITMEGKGIHLIVTAGFSYGTSSTTLAINTWQIAISGNNTVFQRWDSGVWTTKLTITV